MKNFILEERREVHIRIYGIDGGTAYKGVL